MVWIQGMKGESPSIIHGSYYCIRMLVMESIFLDNLFSNISAWNTLPTLHCLYTDSSNISLELKLCLYFEMDLYNCLFGSFYENRITAIPVCLIDT